jgi:hypothetical protein
MNIHPSITTDRVIAAVESQIGGLDNPGKSGGTMMYTVATELPTGERVNGRNYPTLSRAERKALERALELPENAKALVIGNTMRVEMIFSGQIPLPAPTKPKAKRRGK